VVHAHGHQAGSLAVALAATLPGGPPVAVSWHNAILAGRARGALLGVLERLQARRATLLTGASGDLVARARALGARTAELAPVASAARPAWTGDRSAGRAALAAELGLPDGAPLVLTVSRIAPQKDLDVLVDAAVAVHRVTAGRSPGWLVAGDGDPALLAARACRAAAGGAAVRFLGHRDDVPALLALADVFVLASRWEARSLAVQEAMAAGLPIVVTRVGGLPDLVGDAGLTVPVRSPDALAAAVARLCADPGLARTLATRAARRFVTLPTQAQVLAAWAGRYARLAAPPRH